MASPAMNAALRFSSRSTTHKISHVLSGSTRSLSWTSNQAARASVARNAAAYSLIHSQYLNQQVVQRARAFSTSTAVEEESGKLGKVADALRDHAEGGAVQDKPYGDANKTPNREYVPSKTVFVGSLPFFATEEDVRRVLEAAAPVEEIRFGRGKQAHNAPFAHVTFRSMDDAIAVVESAKEEPFYLEGRQIIVSYSERRSYPPSQRLFFDNFRGGDLVALRDFLGENARGVDNAWFTYDKETQTHKPSGIIQFRNVELATQVKETLDRQPGPDGSPVYLRFARDDQNPDTARNRRRRNNNDRRRRDNDNRGSGPSADGAGQQ